MDADTQVPVSHVPAIQRLLNHFKLQGNMTSKAGSATSLSPEMRALIVDWFEKLRRSFGLSLKCVELGLEYFERVLSQYKIEGVKLHNVGIVCFFLAIKFCESRPVKLLDVCRRSAVAKPNMDLMYRLELLILQILQWRLSVATITEFLALICESCDIPEEKAAKLQSLGQVAVAGWWIRDTPASHVAFSLVREVCKDEGIRLDEVERMAAIDQAELQEALYNVRERLQDVSPSRKREAQTRVRGDPNDPDRKRARLDDDTLWLSSSPCSTSPDDN